MRISVGVLALFLTLTCWALPARADLDQLCLKQCVSQGRPSTACLSQCTYDAPAPQATQNNFQKSLSPHRILESPTPLGDTTLPAHKSDLPSPGKDYTCLSQCLQTKQTYALCEKKCTKTQCAPEDSLCNSRLSPTK